MLVACAAVGMCLSIKTSSTRAVYKGQPGRIRLAVSLCSLVSIVASVQLKVCLQLSL